MRLASLVLLVGVTGASPVGAQVQVDPWEFGLGPHVVVREDSTSHNGGSITIARRFQRLAAVFEASGTRREGHNDWRLVGGPRWMVNETSSTAVSVQVLMGTLIRSGEADWAVMPGAAFDVRLADSAAIRLQIDAPIERSASYTASWFRDQPEAVTAKSGRVSVLLVFN